MSDSSMIASLANPRVKSLVRLRQRADERRAAGRFTVETLRELRRAVQAGFSILELYACPERLAENAAAIFDLAGELGIHPVTITPAVLEKIAYRENPQGFIAVLQARSTTLAELRVVSPQLIIVLSGLEKPGNIGAIARTAEAAGASAMFIDSPGFDLFNPNCIRASTGAVFALPVVCDEPAALRDWLKARGIVTIALTPEAKLTHLHLDLRGPVALVVGAEDRGLDDAWKTRADVRASIPMRSHAADSLNVSVSAAILLFDAMRQRVG